MIKIKDKETIMICIIYSINGYFFCALNKGFRPTLLEISSKNLTKKSILNVIILVSRFILHSINYFDGITLNKCLEAFEDDKDFYVILYGIILVNYI